MQALGNLLGDLAQEFPEAIEGKNPNSGFDGPPLPSNRQYRATVTRGEWRQSQAGKWSYSITFEITEPTEYKGKKFSEYYSIDASAGTIGREKFARLIGESGIDLATADTSSEDAFAKEFEGKNFVIATRIWGDQKDRNGIRYLNKDRGQVLKTDIKPLASELADNIGKLKADITVPKREEAHGEVPNEDDTASIPPAEEVDVPQGVSLPGQGSRPPIKLPPGLGG